MSVQAFVSRRVVAPQEILPAAVLVEGERIRAVVSPAQIPSGAEIHDFGDAAMWRRYFWSEHKREWKGGLT